MAFRRVGSTLLTIVIPFLMSIILAQGAAAGVRDRSPGWRISTDVKACAPGTILWVPTHHYSYYLKHPQTPGAPPGEKANISTLQRAAKNDSRPLTSLRCEQGHPGNPLPKTKQPRVASNAISTNWSGYETTANAGWYTHADAEWQVPSVIEPSDKSVVSSIWPGIGEGRSNSEPLIQLGTEQDGTCSLGCTIHKTSYYAWYEIFPQEPQQKISNFPISPNDDISVSVGLYQGKGIFDFFNFTKNTDAHASQTSPGSWCAGRKRAGRRSPRRASPECSACRQWLQSL
jgi:hypothetical protein